MLHRARSIAVLLALLAGCADPTPVLWTGDAGPADAGSSDAATLGDAGSDAGLDGAPDGGSDGGFVPTDRCPCAAYCYELRADVVRDLFVPRPGEIWSSEGVHPVRTIQRTIDGASDALAWPRADGYVDLFGDDEAWVAWNGGEDPDRQHRLYRWDGSAWAEHSIPPFESGVLRWLTVARAGDRLLATYARSTRDAFVWDGAAWSTEHPWDLGWSPVLVAGSADVLAVQVTRTEGAVPTFETWARWGDGAWTRLVLPDVATVGLAVAGTLVLVPGHVFDGATRYPLTGDDDRARFAGVAGGVRWAITAREALDLTDPAAPVRHALPFRAESAAFPPAGPLWVAGAGTAYWDGAAFTVTRAWAEQRLASLPVGAYGAPDDFDVITRPMSGVISIRRFQSGIAEQRVLPAVPWAGSTLLGLDIASIAQSGSEIFVGTNGGVGRTDGSAWTSLHPSSEIDARLAASASAWLGSGAAGVFAGIGRGIYRWDGAAFVLEADLGADRVVNGVFADDAGGAWASTTASEVLERVGGLWEALPALPASTTTRFVLPRSLYATGGHVLALGHEGTGTAVLEWDGTAWTTTSLPDVYSGTFLSGRGAEVVVTTQDLRRWRRRGPGDWELDASCQGAGEVTATWWPEGEALPWLLGQFEILRPREAP